MCLRRKKKGTSTVMSGGFCLRDSGIEQRTLQFLHIYCSNVNSYCSFPESNEQDPPDRTLDLPFFFRLKHTKSLKNPPSSAPSESLPFWFQGNFVAMFVFELLVKRISFVCIH